MNTIKRVVPDIKSTRMDESRSFYVDFLGLKLGMDLGFVMTFISPINPTAQISVARDEGASTLQPNMTVEVADVDEVHAQAIRLCLEIVYPLTDEPWGRSPILCGRSKWSSFKHIEPHSELRR